MRAISTAASITVHAALGATLLVGTTTSDRNAPPDAIDTIELWFPQPLSRGPVEITGGPVTGAPPSLNLGWIPLSSDVLHGGELAHPTFSTDWTPGTGGAGRPDDRGVSLGDAGPEALSGPLPVYPDLLRQAGIEGQVVLEALVDSTGRVQKASVWVVSATNPGFVEPARQALIATLFRPAHVNGRAVPIRVRVPFAFSIRGGMGRAR